MGMDFISIIDHNRKTGELLDLPKLFDESIELGIILRKRYSKQVGLQNKSKWHGKVPMSCTNLELIWNSQKNESCFPADQEINTDAEILTSFGEITVCEKTITVGFFPEHKYGNLRNKITSEYIFRTNRVIANVLGSNQIIYCCDSYFYPSIIEEKSREGWASARIIEFANSIFGPPPTEINEAIENLYFIDDFTMNLDKLDSTKPVWSRADYEYKKKLSGEAPYNLMNLLV